MQLELRHLRVLLEVADSGSITSAAARLGVSQPSLSAQLHRIERTMGGALFTRSTGGVRPTVAGQAVLARARTLVSDVDELVRGTRDSFDRTQVLRVAANTAPLLAHLLAGLRAVRPSPDRHLVPVVDVSTTVLTRQLVDGTADIGFCGVHEGYDSGCPSSLAQRTLVAHEPFFIVMSTSHPLAGQDEVELTDLAQDTWLLPPGEPDGTAACMDDVLAAAGISPRSPLGRQSLRDYWPYVAAGEAVAFVEASAPTADGCVSKPIAGQPLAGRWVLRWNPRRVDEAEVDEVAVAALRAYRRLLAETAARQPWWAATPEHRPQFA